MQNSFSILSDDFSSTDIQNWLTEEVSNPSVSYEFQEPEENEPTRSLDPTVLAAVITGAVTSITVLLQLTVSGLLKAYEKKEISADTQITIKSKDGKEIQFPVGTSDTEVEKLMLLAAKFEGIEYLAISQD
jgi:hypothetical protein